ncbi:MAG: J domain-containing protein [Bacteroidota bacterium]
MVEHDFYKLMQIPLLSPYQDIKKRYYELALLYHPDKNPKNKDAEEYFKILTQGYNILNDPEKKKEYDDLLENYYSRKNQHFEKGRSRQDIRDRIKRNRERERQNIITDYLEAENTFSHKYRMVLSVMVALSGFLICYNHWYVNLIAMDNLYNIAGFIICITGCYFIANNIYRKDAYKSAIQIDNRRFDKRAVKTFLTLFFGLPIIFTLLVSLTAYIQLSYFSDFTVIESINNQNGKVYYEYTIDHEKILRQTDIEIEINNDVYAHYRVKYSTLNPNISELEKID